MNNKKQEEFLTAYHQCHDRFLKYCSALVYGKADVKDLVQEVLCEAYANFKAGKIKDMNNFSAYLLRIARNKVFQDLRKKEVQQKFIDRQKDRFVSIVADPGIAVDIQLLYKCIHSFPDHVAEAIILHKISGFSYKEIAEMQQRSESSVKAKVWDAIQKIKQLMKDNLEEREFTKKESLLLLAMINNNDDDLFKSIKDTPPELSQDQLDHIIKDIFTQFPEPNGLGETELLQQSANRIWMKWVVWGFSMVAIIGVGYHIQQRLNPIVNNSETVENTEIDLTKSTSQTPTEKLENQLRDTVSASELATTNQVTDRNIVSTTNPPAVNEQRNSAKDKNKSKQINEKSVPTQIISERKLEGIEVMRSCDLDKDGDLDLLCNVKGGGKIVWYENLGDNNFSSMKIIETNLETPMSALSADLDNDGKLDILYVEHIGYKLAWNRNEGNGIFGEKQVISKVIRSTLVTVVDFDGDEDLDIVSNHNYGNKREILWFENLGDGNFSDAVLITNVHSYFLPFDMDADGDQDLIVAADSLSWFENNGNGVFKKEHVLNKISRSIKFIDVEDMDNDGDFDILLCSKIDYKIAVYENIGTNDFIEHKINDSRVSVMKSCAVDFDEDGLVDIVSVISNKGLEWRKNMGDLVFAKPVIITNLLSNPNSLIIDDMDNDKDEDILVADGDEELLFIENIGNALYEDPKIINTPLSGFIKLSYADLDGDQDEDIISICGRKSRLCWYENNGNGFEKQQSIFKYSQIAGLLHILDLDNDQDPDIITVSQKWLSCQINQGNANFTEMPVELELPHGIEDLRIGNFNKDNYPDIIITSNYSGGSTSRIYLLTNNGKGNFNAGMFIYEMLSPIEKIEVGDLDGDGLDDLIFTKRKVNKLSWLKNLGNGKFEEKERILNLARPIKDFLVFDYDNDRDLDVMYTFHDESTLECLKNDGKANFTETQIPVDPDMKFRAGKVVLLSYKAKQNKTIRTHSRRIIEDFNGDGVDDTLLLKTGNYSNDPKSIEWYKNETIKR